MTRDGRSDTWRARIRRLFSVAAPRRSNRAYAVTGALLLALLSVVDFVGAGVELGPVSILWSFCLGIGAGALSGGVAGLLLNTLYRMPRGVPVVFWLAVGGIATHSVIDTLGVIPQLSGPERPLALIALALCVGAGLAICLSGLAIQPFRMLPRGWLGTASWWWRVPVCLALAFGFAACTFADREFMVGTYPSAHLLLRVVAIVALFSMLSALVPVGRRIGSKLMQRVVTLSVGIGAFLPVLTLTANAGAELHALLSQPYSRLPLKLLRAVGDPDFDGDSAILGGGDCNSFNPKVHPRAEEIPGNGIDDNCVYGDAPDRLAEYAQAAVPATPSPMSIVLISIDTVRADHMSVYGYERQTTPELARWAERAVVFERAYTPGAWTSLALPTLFRGVYPRRLRWTRLYETSTFRLLRGPVEPKLGPKEKWRRTYTMPVEEPRKPLAWWLRRRGMRTVAVVDDGFSQFLTPPMGMEEGFDVYRLADDFARRDRDDRGVADEAIQELNAMPDHQPFFLWVHFFGPHLPSKRNAGVPSFGDDIAGKYDHEIAFVDKQAGRVLAAVERFGARRQIATIVLSDHGELIRERSRNHGINLQEGSIHVPLMVRAPGVGASRTRALVSLVDVAPTIFAWTQTPAPGGMDGQSLIPLFGGKQAPGRIILSELWRFSAKGEVSSDWIAAMDGTFKLTHNLEDESKRLDLQAAEDGPNLLGRVSVPHLEEQLGHYLEENGRVRMYD